MIAIKNQIIKLAGVVITCAVISACSSDDSTVSFNSGPASSGDADFTTFVSIGDSLTAGFADGALYLLGQQNSFPNILAQQFAAADDVAVAFVQPLVDDNLGGVLLGGVDIGIANRLVLNTETESPERLEGTPTTDVITTLNGMAFNNLGVPGAKSFHLLAAAYGNSNNVLAGTASPYFSRFSTTNAAAVVDDAAARAPSFYTLWIGNNDVLGFATSGGDGSDPITDTAAFATDYGDIVAAMTAANPAVQGVLVNIADVSTIPFFTTVPYNPVPLDQANADALNAAYDATYNAGLVAAQGLGLITAEEAAQRKISFSEGQNAVVFTDDEGLTPLQATAVPLPSIRHATANDLVILPTSAIIGVEAIPGDPTTTQGLGQALADGDVLSEAEIQLIDTARMAFNATIKAAADADANLVFLDAAALMKTLSESGISFGTGSINSDFATGGAFSLDGVHPTGRGYAVVANSIIDAINTGFNANVHKVDPATFPTIFLK